MRILFLGDIVGKVGRLAVESTLQMLRENYAPDIIIANAENAAAGIGITPDIAEKLFSIGVDAITLGNHAFGKREIAGYLNSRQTIIRPMNYPPNTAGRGWMEVEKNGFKLGIANICGRVFMSEYDDPFRAADEFIASCTCPCKFIDFHAEATSEKVAFGYYVDGRVSAVVGTHTHVQTADERVLQNGTAYITDVGMCGPMESVIGMEKEVVLKRFLTLMHERFEVAGGPGVICGVVIDVQTETGAAESIQRILLRNIR